MIFTAFKPKDEVVASASRVQTSEGSLGGNKERLCLCWLRFFSFRNPVTTCQTNVHSSIYLIGRRIELGSMVANLLNSEKQTPGKFILLYPVQNLFFF